MSGTPFTDSFKERFPAGVWWYITYSAQSTLESRISTITKRFDVQPEDMSISRVDYLYKMIQELPANTDKKILILSWSKFTVPETTSDV